MSYGMAITALADPTRRAVLEELRLGPRAVGEIALRLPVSRPAVSQHLRVLKEAGLVRDRAAGTRRIYSVNGDGLAELRDYVNDFWDDALAAFKAAAESTSEGDEDADDK
jgi:DNA-binding transcriptional ArsR family regulator